ncbi:MAG: Uma2 family endonuclease [bacterium]|nr:Uma2 family endonuclease [bacterium]
MRQAAVKEEEMFTYQDYIHFPDNGRRYQIIDGEVYMTPAPVPYHQKILLNLAEILRNFVRRNNRGEVFIAPCDVLLSDVDIVQPDIFFVSREKLAIIKEKYIEGTPDLVIEILSPYTQKLDRITKKRLYEVYKVAEYWIADTDKKTLEVLSLKGSSYKTMGIYKENNTVESDLIKGLKFNLKEIF